MTSNIVYQRTFYGDKNSTPLDSGKVYIGEANKDPEAFPIACFWDAALTVPATQPLAVTSGYITNNGVRAAVYTSPLTYSMRVRNRANVQIDYVAVNGPDLDGTGGAGKIGTVDGGTVQSALDSRVAIAPLRANLKALNVAHYSAAFLLEYGRAGTFQLVPGTPPSDLWEMLYIVSNTPGYYWARVWDQVSAKPEWAGAIADSAGAAATNLVAIPYATTMAPKAMLEAKTYFSSSTIKITTPNRHLSGASSLYDSVYGTGATRLLVTNGTDTALQVGPDTNPGTIGQFPRGIKVSGINVGRSVAPVVYSDCSAVLVQYVVESAFEDVRGDESMNGFRFNGTVHPVAKNCSAKRTSAGTGGPDFWRGFYVNGSAGVGAGGNASVYLSFCHADDTRATTTGSIGFYLDNKFTDTFITDCETVSCRVGLEVFGNSATSNDFGNTDLTIRDFRADQFTTLGIYVHGLAASGSVEIERPYLGPAPGATAAIYVATNKGGAINIKGGQLVMGAAATTPGIIIDANGQKSGAVSVDGTIINESAAGGVILQDATNCRIMPVIQNDSITGGPAVKLSGACTANIIAPIVKGKASGSTYGIQVLGTSDARNKYELTGIDSGTIAGGSGNKLVRNAVQIVATGLTGTNLASGVMT